MHAARTCSVQWTKMRLLGLGIVTMILWAPGWMISHMKCSCACKLRHHALSSRAVTHLHCCLLGAVTCQRSSDCAYVAKHAQVPHAEAFQTHADHFDTVHAQGCTRRAVAHVDIKLICRCALIILHELDVIHGATGCHVPLIISCCAQASACRRTSGQTLCF